MFWDTCDALCSSLELYFLWMSHIFCLCVVYMPLILTKVFFLNMIHFGDSREELF